MKTVLDSNVKMWCSKCQACTKGVDCDFCHHRLTICAECKYCFGCLTTIEQRTRDEEW